MAYGSYHEKEKQFVAIWQYDSLIMLRIGFDFDGVLVYNPARVARLPVAYFKKKFIKQRKLRFWYPEKDWQKLLWHLAHKTSVFPATGFTELLDALRRGKIEGYVITARYSFLLEDFNAWFRKHDPDKLFKGYFLNKRDEQPHLFKERMIKELELNYFVEDNWDIVNYLSASLNSSRAKSKEQRAKLESAKMPMYKGKSKDQSSVIDRQSSIQIHWIYNILDRHIDYPHKHPYLRKFLEDVVMKQ